VERKKHKDVTQGARGGAKFTETFEFLCVLRLSSVPSVCQSFYGFLEEWLRDTAKCVTFPTLQSQEENKWLRSPGVIS
jgi:hypothetical protein